MGISQRVFVAVCICEAHTIRLSCMGVLNGYRCIFVSYLYKSHSTTDSNPMYTLLCVIKFYYWHCCCYLADALCVLFLSLCSSFIRSTDPCIHMYIWCCCCCCCCRCLPPIYRSFVLFCLGTVCLTAEYIYYCYYDSCLIRFRLRALFTYKRLALCMWSIGNSEYNVLSSI